MLEGYTLVFFFKKKKSHLQSKANAASGDVIEGVGDAHFT